MATATQAVPQPLTGLEIRTGIAARIAAEMPPEHAEKVREIIFEGLGKTCSLESSACYSKFKADWSVTLALPDIGWEVDYALDDFGRVTKNRIGKGLMLEPEVPTRDIGGHIPEMPPDKFRRETDQPIPKPVELKKPDPSQSTMSRAARGQGRRRNV